MLACHPQGLFHHFDAKREAVSRLTLFGGVVERAMRGKTDNLAWMEVTLGAWERAESVVTSPRDTVITCIQLLYPYRMCTLSLLDLFPVLLECARASALPRRPLRGIGSRPAGEEACTILIRRVLPNALRLEPHCLLRGSTGRKYL